MKQHGLLQRLSKWLVLPPIIVGIIVVIVLVKAKKPPQKRPLQERTRVLRVIEVPCVDVVPQIVGYGTAEPVQVWRAVSEVMGRVMKVHPRLSSGSLIRAGEEILRIDPTEYELAIAKLNAEILQAEAQISELEARKENDSISLAIEEKSLVYAEKALERSRELSKREAVATADVDKSEREVLAQKQIIQSLKNSLNLLPSQRKAAEASVALKQASLRQAELDRRKTVVHAPFDCRLAELAIEVGQHVNTGELLFEAHGTDQCEIAVQIPMGMGQQLIPDGVDPNVAESYFRKQMKEDENLQAAVYVHTGEFLSTWKGRFDRIRESVDPTTRTAGLVIVVDKPYANAIPGKRPPLIKGSFCEVELQGPPKKQRTVIPRSALHGSSVYVLTEENRLETRAVEVAFAQSNFCCIETGLDAGDILVVSDPAPAIDGMLVDPQTDELLLKTLVADATGQGERQ